MKLDHHRDNNISLFVLTLLCILVVVACQRSETSPSNSRSETPPVDNQNEQRILDSFLLVSDLPEGWFRDYLDNEVVDEEKIYITEFRATDRAGFEYIFVAQDLVLYADGARAKRAYQEKWTQALPNLVEGQAPSEISFKSLADDFKIGCLYSTTALQPENFCAAVARYDRLISILRAKTWDEDDAEQWFTWADFERVLEAMDRRALEAAGR